MHNPLTMLRGWSMGKKSLQKNLQKADSTMPGEPAASFSWGYLFHADLHVTTHMGIFSGQITPVLRSGHAHSSHSLSNSVLSSSGVWAILCRSRHWAQRLPLSPRTTEKLKPRFVFISETQYGKRSFLSENIKELGLLGQYFYFKTARLILYTCL